jgi:hypothetical protein
MFVRKTIPSSEHESDEAQKTVSGNTEEGKILGVQVDSWFTNPFLQLRIYSRKFRHVLSYPIPS